MKSISDTLAYIAVFFGSLAFSCAAQAAAIDIVAPDLDEDGDFVVQVRNNETFQTIVLRKISPAGVSEVVASYSGGSLATKSYSMQDLGYGSWTFEVEGIRTIPYPPPPRPYVAYTGSKAVLVSSEPSLLDTVVNVPESLSAGSDFYDISDAKSGVDMTLSDNPITYAISASSFENVELDPATGILGLSGGSRFDYEAMQQVVVTVVATAETGESSATFTINIDNVNDNPPMLSDISLNLDESSPVGFLVTDLDGGSADLDADGDELQYAIVSQSPAVFQVDPQTGIVTVASPDALAYQIGAQYRIEVEASDGLHVADAVIQGDIVNPGSPETPGEVIVSVVPRELGGNLYQLSWPLSRSAAYYRIQVSAEHGRVRTLEVPDVEFSLASLFVGSNSIHLASCNSEALCSSNVLVGTYVEAERVAFVHSDPLSSPLLETDNAGHVLARFEYAPYGVAKHGFVEEVGYSGHVREPGSGLIYMGSRYYDPYLGRFYSPDPVGFVVAQPASFNRYAYANNNPYMYRDPDGEFAQLVWGAIGGAAFDTALQGVLIATGQQESFSWGQLGSATALGAATGGLSIAARAGHLGKGLQRLTGGAAKVGQSGLAGNKAYQIAMQGGKHAGFLRNYSARSTDEISKGIAKLERRIAEHRDKITNPDKYVPGFKSLDPRQQRALLEKKWPSDIQRQAEQLDVLKGLLDERNLPSFSN